MRRYTPKECRSLSIEEIENARIIYKDGDVLEGDLFFTPKGSWDEEDVPQFDLIAKGGMLYGGDLDDLEYIIDLDS